MDKPLKKHRDNRAAEKKDLTFHPYNITPETAHTAILLLESSEPEVICHTLRAITKFAAQEMVNRNILFGMDAIKYVLLHIQHPEINLRRFALKALSQLCQLPRGPEQVLVDSRNLRIVAFTLEKHQDIYVQEYASLVLSDLTREPEGCHQLISANILGTLFNKMKTSPDPDIQKNCLQTFSNLLHDPVCASEVTKNPQFDWSILLALMFNKYLAIQQTALKTVIQLVSRLKDAVIQGSFTESTGILDLCDILENEEYADIHVLALEALRAYVETDDNADHVYKSGCVLRLLAYLETAALPMKPHCIAVLTRMAFTANGRHALYETGTDLVFCHHLLGSNADLLADAAMGIAHMTKNEFSANRMADTNILEAIGGILVDETAPWFNVRINVLCALCELCKRVPKVALGVIDPKFFAGIRNINKKANLTPIEAQNLAVLCFTNLLNYPPTVKAMLNSDFIFELLNILRRPDVNLKIMTCKLLIGLMTEDVTKTFFSARDGEEAIHINLYEVHVDLRTALCQLIIVSVTPAGADVYLQLGTIMYMIEDKQARYTVAAWEPAIETILRHHPSAKLAYCGQLDINDFTSEGFYVLKTLNEPFMSIKELMVTRPLHNYPILMTMFYPSPFDNIISLELKVPPVTVNNDLSDKSAKKSTSRVRPPQIPDDTNLKTYLNKLRVIFSDTSKYLLNIFPEPNEEKTYRDISAGVFLTLKQRAQVLAEFVSEQMSGLNQERDCSLKAVDLFLHDLMQDLGSRVIGIGWVQCGGALERAILYKVLADRLGLPCSLHRSSSEHAWCEVALPNVKPDTFQETHTSYPSGLHRINYVVDLVESPGRLLHKDTPEAQNICGPTCTPMQVVRSSMAGCKCENRSSK